MAKNLYIMRGLPGSGKSTKARNLTPHIASADDFLVNDSGEYVWSPKRAGWAHKMCRARAIEFAQRGVDFAVDNTNVRLRDVSTYYRIGRKYGYQVHLVESDTPWAWNVEECVRRNTHKVPRDIIQRMADAYECLEIRNNVLYDTDVLGNTTVEVPYYNK